MPDGRLLPLGAPPYTADSIAYAFKSLPVNNLAFAAVPDMSFPIPSPDEPRRRFECLTANGTKYADEPGPDCIAYVRILDEDLRFAVFARGSPKT